MSIGIPVPPTRESIYSALFALAKTATGFKNFSRKQLPIDNIGNEEMPVLYMKELGEFANEWTRGMGRKWILNVGFFIFVALSDDLQTADVTLNTLVDSLALAIAPQGDPTQEVQNLGISGVYDCRISGRIEYRDGLLGPNAFAAVPVQIVTGDLDPGK